MHSYAFPEWHGKPKLNTHNIGMKYARIATRGQSTKYGAPETLACLVGMRLFYHIIRDFELLARPSKSIYAPHEFFKSFVGLFCHHISEMRAVLAASFRQPFAQAVMVIYLHRKGPPDVYATHQVTGRFQLCTVSSLLRKLRLELVLIQRVRRKQVNKKLHHLP